MNTRLFTEYWSFRIFSPVVTGSVIYLLILLVNNNIEQSLESFISDEFFVCIILAALITESTRFLLSRFSRLSVTLDEGWKAVWTILIVVLCTLMIVWVSLSAYFRFALGYQPNLSEIQPFIILYAGLAIAFASVYLSNHFIKKASSEMLAIQEQLNEQAAANFLKLTRGINPNLLFESLESLITYIQDSDIEVADDMIDDLSLVYRYTLSKGSTEVISISEELEALGALSQLINRLPYRRTEVVNNMNQSCYIIPGSLLYIIELIIKRTIVSKNKTLKITLTNEDGHIAITYPPHDKLNQHVSLEDFDELNQSHSLYTDQQITIEEDDHLRSILLPQLMIQTEPTL